MNCMKCGRNMQAGQAFCPTCLQQMENYPVDQDIPVRIPRRNIPAAIKKPPRHRTPSPEERIASLARRLRITTAVLILMLIVCGAMAFLSAHFITKPPRRSGQNYSSITSPNSSNISVPTVPANSPGK